MCVYMCGRGYKTSFYHDGGDVDDYDEDGGGVLDVAADAVDVLTWN